MGITHLNDWLCMCMIVIARVINLRLFVYLFVCLSILFLILFKLLLLRKKLSQYNMCINVCVCVCMSAVGSLGCHNSAERVRT